MHQGKVVEEGAGGAAESEALGAGERRHEPAAQPGTMKKFVVFGTRREEWEWTMTVLARDQDEARKKAEAQEWEEFDEETYPAVSEDLIGDIEEVVA